MMTTKEKNFLLCVLLGLILVLLAIFSPSTPTKPSAEECMINTYTDCRLHTDGNEKECTLAAAALCSGLVK